VRHHTRCTRPAGSACHRARRTRMPRQACARWVKRRVLVPVHDACGSLDGATCWLHTGHAAPHTRRHWLTAACTLPPRPPYSDHAATHTVTGLNLVPKLPPQPPRAGHKSPSFLHAREHQDAAVRHRCRPGELTAPHNPSSPSTPKASSRTQRACTPACCLGCCTCSPNYGSRRPPIAAADELRSPRDPQANQQSQRLQ
jgi:hypothetical protein